MNKVTLLANITSDIESKHTAGGVAIANFGVAYNDKYKAASGDMVEKAHFFNVSAFAKTAENINQYFKKGSRIITQTAGSPLWTGLDKFDARKKWRSN